jgi:prevent-host-death family protein
MQTVTAKEAKNRLGQVIDMALTEKAVAISKNGREAVVLVSADYFRELSGKDEFIKDTHASEKNVRRKEFAKSVKAGQAKSTDASMFQNMKSVVTFRNEEF